MCIAYPEANGRPGLPGRGEGGREKEPTLLHRGALHGLHRRTTSCVADRLTRVQEQQKAVRQYERKSPRSKESSE